MATKHFSKFNRPEQPRTGRITDRSLSIIETILRYRFVSTSQLVRLVSGNEDVTHRHLRWLWESGLINRWAFPGIRAHSEFHYYLDSPKALEVLLDHKRLEEVYPQISEELRNNREKDYASAVSSGQHIRLAFLQHSLMISRFHFMLESASKNSEHDIQLASWHQGAQLKSKVFVPKVKPVRQDGNDYRWEPTGGTDRLPVEPDAFFTLRFEPSNTEAHFFYEADRGTMNYTDMLKKLRAYFHFIIRQRKHSEVYGVHPIRAVLIETSDESRARKLMELVHHPLLYGTSKRARLFWFTISPIFTAYDGRNGNPRYLVNPATLLDEIWAMPDQSLHALIEGRRLLIPGDR